MYRVVTVQYVNQGLGRKRVICRGPLQPDPRTANEWADYLRRLGHYYEVRVESGNATNQPQLNQRD